MRLGALAALVLVSAPAAADVRFDWMREGHARAMGAFAERRWDAALAELRAAFALWPAAGVLFDEGVCLERKGDKRGAADLYRRYLAISQSPPDRDFVERRVAALSLGLDGEPIDPAGVLLVDSAPPGMTVYIDDRSGKPVGRTPWNGHLDGKHTVILAAPGFDDAYRAVAVEARAVTTLRVEAVARGDAARVEVAANVEGARVYFEDKLGEPLGRTPVTLPVTSGRHTLIACKPGYVDARVEVVVGARESKRVEVMLVQRPTPAAAAIVTGAPGARVVVDGKQVCGAAPCVFEVGEGKHRVRVMKAGAGGGGGAWDKQVVFEAAAETTIAVAPGRPSWQATVTSKPLEE